jgi:phage antirepressor YoqD-like protein
MQLLEIGNPVTMTSLELVQFINNQRDAGAAELMHSDFLKKVIQVLGGAGNFSSTYLDAQNKVRPCYALPKREACLMAMSYSCDLQAKVFDRMTELEKQNTQPVAMSRMDILTMAIDSERRAIAAESQLTLAAPKAAFVDAYVDTTGLKGFRQVAKLLKAKENQLREFLTTKQIMYRLGGEWHPYQNHIDAGRLEVKTGSSEVSGHAFNRSFFTSKGVEWLAGLWAVHSLRSVAI